jgi:CubicO group peptidase (beta-lactamase class C family)
VTSYSNHGLTLAAHLVEIASGIAFDRYVEENIFRPLEMRRSTFEQPVPAALAGDASEAYASLPDSVSHRPFE